MNPGLVRVAVVVLLTALVVFAAASALVGLVEERRGKRQRGLVERRLAALVFGLFGGGVLLLSWGLFIEADWLEVTRVRVETPRWPVGTTRRIAHLSDLHVDGHSRALNELVVQLKAAEVDLLVFTGDAINTREATPLFRALLGGLPARLGRVAVRGNHDVYRWGDVDLFGQGVATELLHDAPLVLDDGRLAVCGAPFNALDGVEPCLAHAPKGAFVLFAYHTPDLVEALAPRPDLYLAGHTHGGQVALPWYGALLTFSHFDKRYESGRHEVDGTTLYVSRGVGFEPHLPRLRLFARPELTLIDVVGTGPPR